LSFSVDIGLEKDLQNRHTVGNQRLRIAVLIALVDASKHAIARELEHGAEKRRYESRLVVHVCQKPKGLPFSEFPDELNTNLCSIAVGR
jgi:hypothetical protein